MDEAWLEGLEILRAIGVVNLKVTDDSIDQSDTGNNWHCPYALVFKTEMWGNQGLLVKRVHVTKERLRWALRDKVYELDTPAKAARQIENWQNMTPHQCRLDMGKTRAPLTISVSPPLSDTGHTPPPREATQREGIRSRRLATPPNGAKTRT
jgi:hypothetical protein